jgi:hypothetical protein
MFTGLAAAAVCEVHMMNPIGVDNSERPGTRLGVRTRVRRMVTKLDDLTSSSKR